MKPTKNPAQSVTMWGLLALALPIAAAIQAEGLTGENITLAVGWLGTFIGRWRQGDLKPLAWGKPPAVPPAALLLILGVGTFSGCVAPASEQGKAAQGGSTGTMPVVNVTVTFGGKVDVSGTSSGTAAPSAASEATNRQDAKQDGKLDLSVPVDASGGAGKVLGAVKAPAAPVVVPPEIVAPAPAPVAPAPVPAVPETPAPAPVAPIGG